MIAAFDQISKVDSKYSAHHNCKICTFMGTFKWRIRKINKNKFKSEIL